LEKLEEKGTVGRYSHTHTYTNKRKESKEKKKKIMMLPEIIWEEIY
jgi:hypothetical protein